MSSRRSVPPLDLRLTSYFHYYIFALITHFPIGILGLFYVRDVPVAGICIMLAAMTSLYINLVLRPVVSNMAWRQQGGWHIKTDRDDIHGLSLLPTSRFSSMFCVLHFRTRLNQRIDVLLFPASTQRAYYRALLVLLRSGAGFNDSTDIP